MAERTKSLKAAIVAAVAPMLVFAACDRGTPPAADDPPSAPAQATVAPLTARLIDPAGKDIGSVALSEDGNGVTLRVEAQGLSPGAHGVHLHDVARCDDAGFKAAGAHWNPSARRHGRDNPAGAHSGDLANLLADGAGKASSIYLVGGATLGPGPVSLTAGDGSALIIHAKPDDYKTDPSGDSGDRVACAVIAAPK